VKEFNPKILIVDDEPNNHRVYERTLESLNLTFVRALSGQQALAIAHRHDFFLILMDVQMPGMDGFEAASLLLDHPKTCHIPVIFITAFARDETFEFKGYSSGAVDYLVKPINEEIVRSKVSVFLELYKEKMRLNHAYSVRKIAEEELRLHKDKLEIIVRERTEELQSTLNNLLGTQDQLVESEKMASLGRLVAGVAHELNTPIGICITASSFLKDENEEVNEAINSEQLTKKKLNKYLASTGQSLEIILANLDRASELISNFKLVAVDVSSEEMREFNLLDYIKRTILSLRPEIRRTCVEVIVSGDESIVVYSNPGAWSQIITNLTLNSLNHGYKNDQPGKILIDLKMQNDSIDFNYKDDGKGMDPQVAAMIFEPFFTTKRGCGGSGLGMYIVYNLVTQTLAGEIRCHSDLGKGCSFHINCIKNLMTPNEK